jgi:FKBP-type peptidyl-prolyl cis-trans isomerase FkpA
MKKAAIAILITSALGLSACQQPPADPTEIEVITFETEQQKQAYAMGAMIGQLVDKQLIAQKGLGVVLDKTIVINGFAAALQQKSQFKVEELQAITKAMETDMRAKQQAKAALDSEKNEAISAEYLAENAKREGVIVTDSGLHYEVLTEGEGAKPIASDTVKVHYRGTLLDGTEFDSSYSRNKPIEFPLAGVIKGWTEGVQLMNIGSKFKFVIPSDLAYGPRAQGPIPGNSTLIFDVELLEIITPPEAEK